jgi:hypothetical protein
MGSEFFGVPLNSRYIRLNTSPDNMSVLDQWERRFPIFTDPPDNGEIEAALC